MDPLDTLLTRRSVRRYTSEPLDDDTVASLLRAAMAAPSAVNEQPWHFVVIRERELLDTLAEKHPYARMLKQAPVAVAVCGDTTLEHHPGYWVVDCSAATENLLLAAHAMGLGAVWLGIYPREERMKMLSGLLELPGHVKPLSLVALGHPDEEKRPADRYKPERVHRDRWSAE